MPSAGDLRVVNEGRTLKMRMYGACVVGNVCRVTSNGTELWVASQETIFWCSTKTLRKDVFEWLTLTKKIMPFFFPSFLLPFSHFLTFLSTLFSSVLFSFFFWPATNVFCRNCCLSISLSRSLFLNFFCFHVLLSPNSVCGQKLSDYFCIKDH